MCGINGILQLDGSRASREVVNQMCLALSHRGPDGHGTYFSSNGIYGTGHRRLSILDLSEAGKQPMQSDDGEVIISFNGEIFNFIEIRQTLEKEGFTFMTSTDTEVLLKAYLHWGIDCLNKLNGMWAIAIWHESKEELILAKDRFGIKPLYYYFQPSRQIIFASETAAFKKASHEIREVENNHVHHAIKSSFALEGNGLTIFKHINSVLSGHFIRINSKGTFENTRWWKTLDFRHDVPKHYDEQVQYFLALANDATQIRLRSDVDIATALSGGLDSSSVFGMVQQIAKNKKADCTIPDSYHHAFVASFPNTKQDETAFAKSVIDSYDAPHTIFEQDFNSLATDIIDITRKFDAIYATPIIVASDIYSNMKNSGFSVSMDGHGVDEYMYGYPGLQVTAAREAHSAGRALQSQDYLKIFAHMNGGQEADLTLLEVSNTKANSSPKKRLMDFWKFRIQQDYWILPQSMPIKNRSFPELDQFTLASERELYRQFHQTILPTILRNFDFASMLHGVESRAPFLDHRLVSFMFQLPISAKMGNGFSKRILRDAMKGIIPEQIRQRKLKTGLNAPLKNWFMGPLNEYALDTLHSRPFLNSSHFNGKKIKNEAAVVLQGKTEDNELNWERLWSIFNAHIVTGND